MPYPYSWTPSRVVPTSASQVAVVTAYQQVPAILSTPVAVSAGNITFSLTNPGRYTIVVKVGSSVEMGTFDVDITGVDQSNPEYLSFNNDDGSHALPNTPPALPGLPTNYSVFAMNLDNIISGTITRDSNGAATSASVIWPDGTPGTYTATTVSSTFLGAVDAYTVTYGSPTRVTYTQSAVTRDASGAVTIRPAITVA